MNDTETVETGDEGILKDGREFLALCIAADDQNRTAALDDLTFVSGEQWSPQDRQQRALTGRPCLTINKLPTFLHQVTNDQRQNKASIKVHAVEDQDKDITEVVQGVIRHIEYASNGTVATGTAVNSAATIGFGYFRLVTQYCEDKSFDQEIAFRRIRNAFTVYPDPAMQEPDGSDQMRCMLSEKMPRTEFRRLYPDANASASTSFATGVGDETLSNWLGDQFVRIAEFYRVEMTNAWLVNTDQGPAWEDELPEFAQVLLGRDGKPMRRKSAKRKVMWYKITATDVLERAEIPCRWIPVFPVFGDEIDLDGKVIRSGLVRHAKDPARMYNYWMTAATEEVALRAKTPFVGAEGQFEGHEDEWAAANVSSFPYLEYKPTALDGALLPPPNRQPMADVPIGTITMARQASDDVKATTGLFDSSLGNRGTATSGIQERAQQLQGDTANYHYQDNLQITLRHAGRCIVDMIPKVYDGQRIVQIMGEDEQIAGKLINDGVIDLTKGKYDVTIGTGPSYSTARQEATDNLIEMGKAWPKLMDVAGDKIVRGMDFLGSDQVADRLKRTIPPEVLGDEDKDDQEQEPMVQTPHGPVTMQQASQMIAQLSQDSELMATELEKAQSGEKKAMIDAQSKREIAEMNNAANIEKAEIAYMSAQDVQELRGLIELLKIKITPPPTLAADAATPGKASGKSTAKDAP